MNILKVISNMVYKPAITMPTAASNATLTANPNTTAVAMGTGSFQQASITAGQLQNIINTGIGAGGGQWSQTYQHATMQGHYHNPNPEPPTEEEIEGRWIRNPNGQEPHTDNLVARMYLSKNGFSTFDAMTMPTSLVHKLVTAFRKLETGDLDTELIFEKLKGEE